MLSAMPFNPGRNRPMATLKSLPLILLLLFALAAPVVHAAAVSLEQAVAQVRRDTGGRILAAQTVQENGRTVHVIKVLTPDRSVRTVRVPAGK